MTEELKIVVDVSKPLSQVAAVSALVDIALIVAQNRSNGSKTFETDLDDALDDFVELDGFNVLNRKPSIVGAETQVGQFVTASPAYGVYAGEPVERVAQIGDTTQDVIRNTYNWAGLGAAYGQMAADLAGVNYSPADPAGAASRASALMDDGRRFRATSKMLSISWKRDKGEELTLGECKALEFMDMLEHDEAMPQDDATAAIIYGADKIIASRLLEDF